MLIYARAILPNFLGIRKMNNIDLTKIDFEAIKAARAYWRKAEIKNHFRKWAFWYGVLFGALMFFAF